MAKGISIPITGDAGDFSRAVDQEVIKPLEDIDKTFDKIKNGSGLDSLEKDMRNAQKATKNENEALDDLRRNLKESQRAAKDFGVDVDSSGNAIGRSYKKGAGEASESVRTFKDESKANLSEVVSSFDGSAQSITDLFQGTLGGVIQDLGPLGIVAGAAGAVGVGLIGAAIQNAQADAEEFKERVKGLTNDLVSEFLDAGEAINAVDDRLRDFASDNEKYGISLSDLAKDAQKTGTSLQRLAKSITGDSVSAAKEGVKYTEQHIKALREEERQARSGSTGQSLLADQIGKKADVLQNDVLPALKANEKANRDAAATEKALAAAQGLTVSQYRAAQKAAEKSKEATEAYASSVSDAANDIAESSSDAISNEAENAQKYIDSQRKKLQALEKFGQNASSVYADVDDNTRAYLESQGSSLSDEYATYVSATPQQKAQIRESWKTQAEIESDPTKLDADLEKQKDRKVKGPTAKVDADTSDLDGKTDKKSKERKKGPTSEVKGDTSDVDKKTSKLSKDKHGGPTMQLKADDDAVERAVNRYKNKTYHATVVFNADTSNLTAALNRIDGRHVNVIVDQQPGKKVA